MMDLSQSVFFCDQRSPDNFDCYHYNKSMMTVGVRDLKEQFSQYLKYVKDGEAVVPVIGWNQWVKWVAPFSIAHSFIALAATLATSSSR
jgi:hypothetical protein